MSNTQRGTTTRPVAILIATQMRMQGGGKPTGAQDVGKQHAKTLNSSPVSKSGTQSLQTKPISRQSGAKQGGTSPALLKPGAQKPLSRSVVSSPERSVEVKSNVALSGHAQRHADAISDTMSQKKPNLLSALGHGMKLASELKRNPPAPLSEMPKHDRGGSDGGSGDERFRISSNVKLEGKAQAHAESMRTAMAQKKPDLLSALKHGVKLAQEMKRNPPAPLSEMPSVSSRGGESNGDDRFRVVSSHALEGQAKSHADALRDAMSQKQPDIKAILAHGVRLAQSIRESRNRLSPMRTETRTTTGNGGNVLSKSSPSTSDRDGETPGQGG